MPDSTLFIPDISGFTKFVKNTEIKHGQHIIEELIALILKEGSKSFEVAEIEGDAVFFFKHNKKLSIDAIAAEAERIYTAFHTHLQAYDHRRICNCGACSTASDLQLKFVTHSGEIALADFGKDKNKPYGEPVIAVHRLLKTKIGHKEYLLFSDGFRGEEQTQVDGSGSYQDQELGTIPFGYRLIDDWREGITPLEAHLPEVKPDIQVLAKRKIPFNIDILHTFITDFRYRHLWNHEADDIIFDESKINQIGAEHYCIVNGKNLFFDTIKPKVEEVQRSYGEVLKNPSPLSYFETNFVMTPIDDNATLLDFRMSAKFKWVWQKLLSRFITKKFEKKAKEALEEIATALAENIKQVD